MKRQRHESERSYLPQWERTDKRSRWETEAGYLRGTQELGEDAGENTLVDFSITPSGSPTRQTDSPSTVSTVVGGLVDAFKATLPAVASVIQQREFNKTNLSLINSGRPPMSPQQYMALQPPTANVVVGPNANAQKWIIYAGIGIAALVGLRAAKII